MQFQKASFQDGISEPFAVLFDEAFYFSATGSIDDRIHHGVTVAKPQDDVIQNFWSVCTIYRGYWHPRTKIRMSFQLLE